MGWNIAPQIVLLFLEVAATDYYIYSYTLTRFFKELFLN
jgi:hypothetical protein